MSIWSSQKSTIVDRWMMMPAALLLAILLLGPVGTVAAASELTIAAASDLNFAFREMVGAYERQSGVNVKLSLGSSGNFFSQIQNGAPFDLYFSADIRYPQKLVEAGYAKPDSLYRYAVGRIVLWLPNGSPLDLGRGLALLTDPSIKKIAIANPKHAPYGRAAVAALQHSQLYDRVKDRLVLGENVSQAAQFVESGACETGIIALSLALAPTMKTSGRYWLIPAEAHPALEQGAVILRSAPHSAEAEAFLAFLKSQDGQAIMHRYGFTLPE